MATVCATLKCLIKLKNAQMWAHVETKQSTPWNLTVLFSFGKLVSFFWNGISKRAHMMDTFFDTIAIEVCTYPNIPNTSPPPSD